LIAANWRALDTLLLKSRGNSSARVRTSALTLAS
jgi:hypothetical protein